MKPIAAILMLTALAAAAGADSADVDAAYFHPAASLYIHGDAGAASNLVARGLSLYPDDGKLKRLKELLEKQQQNENQQNQDQQQDQQNQDQQQDQQDQQQDQQDRQQDQQDQQDQDQQDQDRQQAEQQQPERAEEMTEDEARQLLDAMKQEEKNKRMELHPVYGAPVRVDKDW
jgi:uncharacterized protein YaiI (UPF0178 family)